MPDIRQLTVTSSTRLTPNMQRVVLGGEELTGFPSGHESGYVKLLFPDHPDSSTHRPLMRTYTIRAFDAERSQLTLDFALHSGNAGPASVWAENAKAGDSLLIAGPGSARRVSYDGDSVFLVGDITALPAIAANLEQLPPETTGQVLIEVVSEEDRQSLQAPEGVEIHWLINPEYSSVSGKLAEKLKTLAWPGDDVAFWCACEFHSMREIRRYVRQSQKVRKSNMYVSSYWKIGRSEDEHKIDKNDDQRQDEQVQTISE